jgi:putative ATP-dependent endonuclease of OLD family
MQLSELRVSGFRNLDGVITLQGPLALVAGENNSGKSNVIDAIRLLLRALGGPREQLYVSVEDFRHDGKGDNRVPVLEIQGVFTGLDSRQRGRMVTCLAPSRGGDVATITLRATLLAAGRGRPEWQVLGGEANVPDVEAHARSAATYTYLHPLRDAQSDLRPGRSNRLVPLLSAVVGDGADRDAIETIAQAANDDLGKVQSIADTVAAIKLRLDDIVGASYGQQVKLAFSDPVFERIVGTLRALVGDSHPLEMTENGLGLNNLLYIATLLAGLEAEPEGELHLLLVEEPEAHLHPQLQDLLMRYLERSAMNKIQVVVTTHSPNFAAATGVERMTVLARERRGARIEARAAGTFGLSPDELGHLRRFLDVTKSSLLFARGVVLVEGIAEQLLMPAFARAAGLSLAREGIAVVNVGGLAFGPFAKLFGDGKLPYRCAIVSDGDPPKPSEADGTPEEPPPHSGPSEGEDRNAASDPGETADNDDVDASATSTEDDDDEDTALSRTAQSLAALENDQVKRFLSKRTLEWDLVAAGNWDAAVRAWAKLHPVSAARLRKRCDKAEPEAQADAFLAVAKRDKGRFAQALAELAESENLLLTLPPYLSEALAFVARRNDEHDQSSQPSDAAAS